MDERFAGSAAYLDAFALVLGAHFHMIAAAKSGPGSDRAALARCYFNRLLPDYRGLLDETTAGHGDLRDLSDTALGLQHP